MKWTTLKNHPSMKVDEAGNILQRTGAIVPKACQKCGRKFIAMVKTEPRTQNVPSYKCEDCKWTNSSAEFAWDHEKAQSHKITKIKRERISGYITYLSGALARIDNTGVKPKILCDNCLHGVNG